MKALSRMSIMAVATATMLALCMGDALAAANCGGSAADKKKMGAAMDKAKRKATNGSLKEAYEAYDQAESMGACPIMAKECKKAREDMINEVKEAIDDAKALGKDKEASVDDVTAALCTLCDMELGWQGRRDIVGAAGKARKKLASKKRKVLKEKMKEGDALAKEQLKEAKGFLKKRDYSSALNCLEEVFDQYPYTKGAMKQRGIYLELKRKVAEELAAEEG